MAEPTYFGAHLAELARPDSRLAGTKEDLGDGRPVAIIGGGPVGMALALALTRRGIAAEIYDARPRGAARNDKRVLALSHGSQQTFEWLGIWPQIFATPIETIHISQQGGFGRTRLTAQEQGVPALGQVAAVSSIVAALDDALDDAGVVFHGDERIAAVDVGDDAVHLRTEGGKEGAARLVVYAEGMIAPSTPSSSKNTTEPIVERHYSQHALICSVATRMPHGNVAWERFTPQGPLALLPCGDEYAVVYTCAPVEAERLVALGDDGFLAVLQTHFGGRLQFTACTSRHVFPLGLRYRPSPVGPRSVWLGNAAQTLHPVAGQGFNLALRDIMQLARTLTDAADPGAATLLAHYAAARRLDRNGVIGFTDTVVRLFSNDTPLLREGRGLALLALDLVPPLRSFVARRMMYGARAW